MYVYNIDNQLIYSAFYKTILPLVQGTNVIYAHQTCCELQYSMT